MARSLCVLLEIDSGVTDDMDECSLRFQFGRCSVNTFFPAALEILRTDQELFSSFVENKISWDDAEEVSYKSYILCSGSDLTLRQFYKLFEQNKVAKTAFVAHKA